jgi:integrase/recombinase XerD
MTADPMLQRQPTSPSQLILRAAVAAYLAAFQGMSRSHTDSPSRVPVLVHDGDRDPLAARRIDIQLYLRWLQEIRRFKPNHWRHMP